MNLKKDNLVVCSVDGNVFPARVLAAKGKAVAVVQLKNEHIPHKRHTLEVDISDVKINLGDSPPPGKAYGYDFTKVYRGRREHEHFGTLNFFYKPKKEIRKSLFKAYDVVYKKLDKLGLAKIAGDDIVWEIEPYNNEKYAGMYYPGKGDKDLPRIAFKPESVVPSMYPYVILHELAHHMHLTYLKRNAALEAKWISLFNTSIKVINIPKDTSQQILDILLDSDVPASKLRSELDDDLKLAYTWILRTIQQNHAVSVDDLNVLLRANYKDEVKALWPRFNLKKKDLQPVISLYACKNVKETVAEAISLHLTGTKLPKQVIKLTERTLSYIKTQV